MSRKERQPSVEDEATVAPLGLREKDPPRKRVDSRSTSSPQLYLQRARYTTVQYVYSVHLIVSSHCVWRIVLWYAGLSP